jgi:hypothetical protein
MPWSKEGRLEMGTVKSGILMYAFSLLSTSDDITVGACFLVVVGLLFSGFVVCGALCDAAEEELGVSLSWGGFDIGTVVIEKFFDGVCVEDADEGVKFASCFLADTCERYAYAMLPMRAVISVGEDARKLSMDLLGGRVGMYGVSLVGLVVEGGEEGVDLSLVLQTPK